MQPFTWRVASRVRLRTSNILAASVVLALGATLLAAVTPDVAAAPTVSYLLPWTEGVTWHVSQGNDGQVSHGCPDTAGHTTCFSYDFDMNVDQPIRASANGTLLQVYRDVKGQLYQSGGTKAWGNFVVLQHADGTCTRYAHMKHGSVFAKARGDFVLRGEQLGLVGNTGYTLPAGRGHHLHFQREHCPVTESGPGGASIQTGFVETRGAVLTAGTSYMSQNELLEGRVVRSSGGGSAVIEGGRRRGLRSYHTELCAAYVQGKGARTISADEFNSIPEVDGYSCELNGTVLRAVDRPEPKPSFVIRRGKRYFIKNGQTYRHLTLTEQMPVGDAPLAEIEDGRLPFGGDEPLQLHAPDYIGKMMRFDGVDYVVGKGGKRHRVPDFMTMACGRYHPLPPLMVSSVAERFVGKVVQSELESIPSASQDYACSLDGTILHASDRPEPKPAWTVRGGKKYVIRDGWTFDYFVRNGWRVVEMPYSTARDGGIPLGGHETARLDARAIPANSIVTGLNRIDYVVDDQKQRHRIPFIQDNVCWRHLRGLQVVATGLTDGQLGALPEKDAWPCIIGDSGPQGDGRVVKSDDGKSYFVDRTNTRHHIPDVDTFNVLARTYAVSGPWPAADVDFLPQGNAMRAVVDSVAVANTVICRDDNVCWIVDAGGYRHHIPTHGDSVCWRWGWGWTVSRSNLTGDQANSLEEREPWSCSMHGWLISTASGKGYYMEGNSRRPIHDGWDYNCLTPNRKQIRGISDTEADGLGWAAVMPMQSCHGARVVAFRSRWNGLYVSAELGYSGQEQYMLRARHPSVDDWERFRIVGDCSNWCAIQSYANRLFVAAEQASPYEGPAWGELRARSGGIGEWELFRIEGDCSQTCALKSKANGRYVRMENDYQGNGRFMLRADAQSWSGWESFNMYGACRDWCW